MAEILTSLVKPAMEELGRLTVATIKRQFNYLCCFKANIQSLRDEARKLDHARGGLQMEVDTDERNTKIIVPEVKDWLDASIEIQVKMREMEVEIKDVQSGCLAIKPRYLLNRKAKKTVEAIEVLRDSCKFKQISTPAPPASTVPIPQGTTYECESRKQIEDEIMEALRGKEFHTMGICGMGGLGKTTMAKRVMNRVRDENLFDEAVMAVVSQEVDKLKIQGDIAEFMGLDLNEKSLLARAKKIRDRLMGAKRILLILDDVWEMLNLEELGIPCEGDRGEMCKILLTSRSGDVLRQMDAQVYAMKILSEVEAWFLFREKIGTCVDDLDLLSMPKEVVEECKGLPLALITVGKALKDKRSEHWKVALKQLRSSNRNIPEVLKEVYNPIKLSYDFLDNPDARSLFLLCCMFPEDFDIRLDYLTLYSMGLRMFTEDIGNLEEARDNVRVLLDMLKSCFLLLDGRDKDHVKMHDVVRDVGIAISSKEGPLNLNFSLMDCSREQSINCSWVSLVRKETIELPIKLSFPSLRLLVISSSMGHTSEFCLFPGMIELNVLAFYIISFRSLPQTIELQQNLRTLYLEYCTRLETISIVGQLLNLETFICRSCCEIAELPVEMGRLKQLKLLEVSDCERLERIVPGVISQLVQLEELKIVKSFRGWERKDKGEERNNAAFCELELLSNLTSLEIEIEDVTLAAEEIRFPSKIVKYQIILAPTFYGKKRLHEKGLQLDLKETEKEITFGKWIHIFLRSTEHLDARGDGSNNLDLAQARNMKTLSYGHCSKVNQLVNITASFDWSLGVFPQLEYLDLHYLPCLEKICDGPILKASNSFENVKKIKVYYCWKLRKLPPLQMTKIKSLNIRRCPMLEEVFSHEENEKDGDICHVTFPRLNKLKLFGLDSLTTFCKGSEYIEFPVLNTISIKFCEKLTSWDSLDLAGHDDDSLHLFCNQKVIFGSLKSVHIGGYDDISNIWCQQIPLGFFNQLEMLCIEDRHFIQNLFSSSIALNLVNLKALKIEMCSEMVKVIEDGEIMLCDKPSILFPSLVSLEFNFLDKLQSFGKCICDFRLPLLERVSIMTCPLLEFFTTESATFDSLKEIHIYYCHGIRSLFSILIAKNLVNLEKLKIGCCSEIVKVIEDEEILFAEPYLLFPRLQDLILSDLPKLQSFCKCRCDIQFPSLKVVFIVKCPLLEFITMGSVSTPNLRRFRLNEEEKGAGDLNVALQLHFKLEQKKGKIEEEESNEESSSSNAKEVEANHMKGKLEEQEEEIKVAI